ncbi:hypothetical protein GCM10027348_32960 [Hymenobacter tenuis]
MPVPQQEQARGQAWVLQLPEQAEGPGQRVAEQPAWEPERAQQPRVWAQPRHYVPEQLVLRLRLTHSGAWPD